MTASPGTTSRKPRRVPGGRDQAEAVSLDES